MIVDSPTATKPASPIAGFTIVRTLGRGERASVLLGHGSEQSRVRRVAIKVYRPDMAVSAIDAELRALERAQHAHVVRVHDVATLAGGGPCIILEPLTRGSLERLLALRDTVSAGEAVTILAPVAAAVATMHSSGVCHGGIGAGAVLFRESGAPVLARFGRATLFDAGSPPIVRASIPALLADGAALAQLATTVLRSVGSRASALSEWIEGELQRGDLEGFAAALSERVFELGAAEPVRWTAGPTSDQERVPARVEGADHERSQPMEITPPVSRREGALITMARAGATRVLGSTLLSRAQGFLPQRHRALWLAAVAGGASLVVMLALIPAPSTPTSDHEPSAVVRPTDAEPTPPDAATAAVLGDDPVAAFAVLLAVRQSCVRDLSVLCLDAVAQSGSAALDDDVALIRAVESGSAPLVAPAIGSQPVDHESIELIERYGDAALVRWGGPDSETASALLVKGEAGWRVRDYLAD